MDTWALRGAELMGEYAIGTPWWMRGVELVRGDL